jgi:hypothetical protein
MAISKKRPWPDRATQARAPIKYLTENGFTIVRLSEIDASVKPAPSDCRFLVQHDDRSEREIRVAFTDALIENLRIKRRTSLPEASPFWIVCAESCLAQYLWEQNEFPPNDQLIVEDLSPDELMLALHWRDSH